MEKLKRFLLSKSGMGIFSLTAAATAAIVCFLIGYSIQIIIKSAVLAFLLSLSSAIDIKTRELDNAFPFSVFFLSFSFVSLSDVPFILTGALLGLLVTLIPALSKNESVGGADIKMCMALGAFLGPVKVALSIIIAITAALIYGKVRKVKSIPLIPFLFLGVLPTLFIP